MQKVDLHTFCMKALQTRFAFTLFLSLQLLHGNVFDFCSSDSELSLTSSNPSISSKTQLSFLARDKLPKEHT
eukprot:5506960-Amphidinium_carterae.3